VPARRADRVNGPITTSIRSEASLLSRPCRAADVRAPPNVTIETAGVGVDPVTRK